VKKARKIFEDFKALLILDREYTPSSIEYADLTIMCHPAYMYIQIFCFAHDSGIKNPAEWLLISNTGIFIYNC
jgi:hypothetical protein